VDNINSRVLGRVLAVEELADVAGGWTLGSAGDTAKSTDTGAYQVDTSNCLNEMLSRPIGDNPICSVDS
jgi:hypothetical protein